MKQNTGPHSPHSRPWVLFSGKFWNFPETTEDREDAPTSFLTAAQLPAPPFPETTLVLKS